MVHDNCPAGVIITNGLGGDYRTWILAQFDLFLGFGSPPEVEVGVRVIGGGGASFRPETYPRPREDEDEGVVWEPREDEEFEVIITARVGQKNFERHYFVRKRTQVVVTQVLHFLNTTQTRMSIVAGKIRKTAKDVAVSIRNIGKRS